MELTLISDTHNLHNYLKLKGGELIIHAGDCSRAGKLYEVKDFLEWFNELPYEYKIFIPGNHDFFFEIVHNNYTHKGQMRHGSKGSSEDDIKELLSQYKNITYLNDSGVEIKNLKFWGSPVQPWFHDWAFNRREDIQEHWDMIPDDTDVIITHGPAYGHGDKTVYGGESVGCPRLLNRIKEINPKLHVCGHIHEGYGMTQEENTTMVNASSVNIYYEVVNKPIIVTI
jgi:Icc-related predicted phosphoesterase